MPDATAIASPRPARRFLVLSLRLLMLLIALLAFWLGWITNRARRQAEVVEAIHASGRGVHFAHEYTQGVPLTEASPIAEGQAAAPTWLRGWLGEDYFRRIVYVAFNQTRSAFTRKAPPLPFRNDDELLRALCELGDVKSMSLETFEVGESRLAPIGRLRELEVFHLGALVKVCDDDLACLRGLQRLQEVWLGNDLISGRGLVHLTKLPALESLGLGGDAVEEAHFVHLLAMRKLKDLTLATPLLTDSGLMIVARLPALESLNIHSGGITDAGVAQLVSLKNLKGLGITTSGEPLTDRTLVALQQLKSLESLSLGSRLPCTRFSDEGLLDMTNALPRLQELVLEAKYFDHPALDEIKQRHPEIILRREW